METSQNKWDFSARRGDEKGDGVKESYKLMSGMNKCMNPP